jgi:hypothetical protein
MRIGMMIGEGAGECPRLDEIIARAQRIEAAGLSTGWMANIFAYDAINLLGLVGRETKRLELGTAVVPTYPRHPAVMAQQALTTAGREQRTLHAGNRSLTSSCHRKNVWLIVRAPHFSHARISRGARRSCAARR